MKKQPNNLFSRVNGLILDCISYIFCGLLLIRSAITKIYFSFINIDNPIIRLMRLDKPVGYLLVVFPTWWVIGMTAQNPISILFFCLFFLVGAILVRGAGCIINDILDKEIDKKVARTKDRPLASDELTIKQALQILLVLLFFAVILLLMLPKDAVYIGIFAMIPISIYPLMKRVTYFPQVFLGFTFNIGVLIAWLTVAQNFGWPPVLIYFASVFWTLGYDTLYAYQDIKDDIKLNIKSTAIKFKEKGPKFVWYFYQITLALICIAGLHMHLNFGFFAMMSLAGYQLYWQIENIDILDEKNCAAKFKSNIEFACLVFAAVLIGRI